MAPWSAVRRVLHPSQQAVGYAAVKRKLDKDYKTAQQAQARMNESGSHLPFVLGPQGVPYLVDSHHTASALEASGYSNVHVTLHKIGDWSQLSSNAFFQAMKSANFMMGVGRTTTTTTQGSQADNTTLPVPIDVARDIPRTIPQLGDDPWRSLAALVRKVNNKEACPPGHDKCMRGYIRDCRDDGSMTAFFEFRWAYFMNYAYNTGCDDPKTTLWDDASDCRRFQAAFRDLMKKNQKIITQRQFKIRMAKHGKRRLVCWCRSVAVRLRKRSSCPMNWVVPWEGNLCRAMCEVKRKF